MSIPDSEKIQQSLMKLATGYEYEEREYLTTPEGQPIKIKITKKRAQPQLDAIREVRRLMAVGSWKEERPR
jgi:hypothetical protein